MHIIGRAILSVAFSLAIVMLSPCTLHADVTGITGSGLPFSTQQPSLVMNYLISLNGLFPARDGDPPQGRFLGEVTPFAGNFAPGGWAMANGQLLPINQNQALFSLLGTTYGGDGVTNFALPDLRGRSVIGTGQGPGLSNRSVGEQDGVPNVTLTVANLPSHDHTLPGGGVTGFTGGNQPFTTVQPSLAMNYIINEIGNFPSQGGGSTDFPFYGQVNLFAGSPNYFATAPNTNGQLLAINQNQALFSILGTTYGGDGVQSFALPDLRGRTAIGAGQGPGLSNRFLGEKDGQETTTMTVSQMPAHNHTLPGGGVTGVTGSSLPIDNMQPSTTLHYMIALNGIFPSQGGGGSLDEPMLGQMALFAGDFAPSGWAFANGQILSIAQNTALFSILGTTYGGNGQSNFALPDLRGRDIIGMGQGPGLENFDLGEVVGTESISLVTANLAPHDHTLPVPEPASLLLAFLGATGALVALKRSRNLHRRFFAHD
jgi:microcystin-dependent protein